MDLLVILGFIGISQCLYLLFFRDYCIYSMNLVNNNINSLKDINVEYFNMFY
jgi:hypothetical protein